MSAVSRRRHARCRTALRSGITGVAAGVLVGALVTLAGLVLPATSARAADSSAVTVTAKQLDPDSANSPLPDLAVTVSQTRDLLAQGIELSWTGGTLSGPPQGANGGSNFLQVMQCWGNDPADANQPDRTTCQYGALGTAGDTRYSNSTEATVIAPQDTSYASPPSGFISGYTSVPFRSVTGVTVADVVDGKRVPDATEPGNNQFFTKQTTNEVAWAGSGANGEGSIKFEVQTAAQAAGLGCGAPTTTAGVTTGTPCWLVLIPRGSNEPGLDSGGIVDSGLLWNTWKHKLAIKLGFQPIGARCAIGSAERQLAGSELLAEAVRSWQPQLCGTAGGAAYTLIGQAESDAALAANGTDAQPLALTSRALTGDAPDALTYAPVGLTGLAISFAVDRSVKTDGDLTDPKYVAALNQNRLPFKAMKLTPRLVAKLLTNSYWESLPSTADRVKDVGYGGQANPGHNARNLTSDPEFIAINDPEWAYQAIVDPSVADLMTPLGRSDGAEAIWSYVLSDPLAVSFLAGTPDDNQMTVNKYYSTDAAVNLNKTGLQLPADDYPKADPIEAPADSAHPALNLITYRPYTNDYDSSALNTLRGDGLNLGAADTLAVPPKWGKAARRVPGQQAVLGLTDTSSAAKYQVYTASLLNAAGSYVQPTVDTLTAAAAAMTPSATQPQVVSLDSTSAEAKAATNAYPLAMPVYAAVNKAMTDPLESDPAKLRADYAAFIRYAVGAGQTVGTSLGQLPAGYAPVPADWKAQALAAASAIDTGHAPDSSVSSPGAAAPAAAPTTTSNQPQAVNVTPAKTNIAPVTATVQTPVTATDPTASGAAAAPLLGADTPDDPVSGAISAALPASILAALGAALAVPFISRGRRRV